MNPLDLLLAREITVIGLVFCRVGAALMVLPAFGEPYVVSRVRLGMALAIALLVGLPMSARLVPPTDVAGLTLLVVAEVLTGLLIGAIIRLVMFAVHFGGSLVAMQSGLATAAFFDPQEATQGTVTGNLLAILALVVIVVSDAHLLVLRALTTSFSVVETTASLDLAGLVEVLVRLGGEAIETGLRMAAPIVLFSLLLYLLLGVLNRLMPSFQVLFVAMPLQIVLAFGLFMLSLGSVVGLATTLLRTTMSWLEPF
ncbi:MAG: flagellar biosynthetic protein FliR [Geminicoccaceae bacterium]